MIAGGYVSAPQNVIFMRELLSTPEQEVFVVAEVSREGLYWNEFDPAERKLLRRAGFDPAEADAFGAVDGELALLRVLTLRLLRTREKAADPRQAEAVARLVERVGRVLRARQALKDDGNTNEWLEKVDALVLQHQRTQAREEVNR